MRIEKPVQKIALKYLLAFLCIMMCKPIIGNSIQFFVAPNGNDENPGSKEMPFASISRAQLAARLSKKLGKTKILIQLREGTYYLKDTLRFTETDSGLKDFPVVYQAYKGEEAVLSGGSKLQLQWEKWQNGVMKAKVPKGFKIDQLFVNGKRQIMARYPNFNQDARANSITFVGNPDAVRDPLFHYEERPDYSKISKEKGPKTNDYPAECLVYDNLLISNGRFEKQSAGVNISMSSDITVRHNTIYDCPRAGINICDGTWGGHVIEFNDVFDTVNETGDHGAFNSWGRDRYWPLRGRKAIEALKKFPDMPKWDAVKTSIIRNNRFRCDFGWDIDLDDGSSNYVIRNNLCLSGGIKLREGFFRVCENNIMANNSLHPHKWFQNSGDIVRNNIVFSEYKPILMNKPWGKEINYNFRHKPEKAVAPATTLQKQSGRDAQSLTGDALFIDPSTGNLNLGGVRFTGSRHRLPTRAKLLLLKHVKKGI